MKKGEAPIRVAVIGTCRVHHTARALEQAGHVILHNGGMDSFVHSPPEILLRLEVLLGKTSYSDELVNLQVGESPNTKLSPDVGYNLLDADVLVIEVSSLKTVSAFGLPLQFNEVNRHLCTPFGQFGKELMANINHAFNKRLLSVQAPASESPDNYPRAYLDLLQHLRVKVLSQEEIVHDLNKILSAVNLPVLLVNHINVEGSNGKLLTSRNRLCNIVRAFCNERGTALFEPASMFETMDRTRLLMDDGQDVNHYAKAELLNVGMKQLEAIQQAFDGNIS